MREILFRGIGKNDGILHYGGIVHQTDFYGDKCDRWFIIDGTDTQDYDIGYEHEVIPETVGQYTGRSDKNWERIFENDIVKIEICYDAGCYTHTKQETIVVTFRNGVFYPLNMAFSEHIEVIGNIHDNPELLKEGNHD